MVRSGSPKTYFIIRTLLTLNQYYVTICTYHIVGNFQFSQIGDVYHFTGLIPLMYVLYALCNRPYFAGLIFVVIQLSAKPGHFENFPVSKVQYFFSRVVKHLRRPAG